MDPTASASRNEIKTLWLETLRVPDASLDESFFALGGDSLQLIELVVRICKIYQVDFDYDSFLETPSLRTLVDLVSNDASDPPSADKESAS